MAIMNRCCCFSNTKSGSTASGIYSLVYCVVMLGFGGFNYATKAAGDFSAGVQVLYILNFVFIGFLFIASILLLCCVSKDSKGMLIPYMVALSGVILLEIINWIVSIAVYLTSFFSWLDIFILLLGIALTIVNIFCLLCVISQYQVLRDGMEHPYSADPKNNVEKGGAAPENVPLGAGNPPQ